MKRCIVIVLCLTLVLCLAAACSQSPSQSPAPSETPAATPTESPAGSTAAPSGERVKMAWLGARPIGWFENVGRGAERFKEDFANEYEVFTKISTDANATVQAEDMQAMVAQGCKYLSVYPADANSINGITDELNQHGVEVIVYGAPPSQPSPTLFCCATDHAVAATIQTEYLCELMGYKGNILLVLENLTDPMQTIRKEAVQKVIDGYPEMSILQIIGDLKTSEAAVEGIASALAANANEIDGILPNGYNTGAATVAVLQDYRSSGGPRDIKAVAWETDETALKGVRDGVVEATVAQNTTSYGMGYISMYVLKLLNEGWVKRPDAPYYIDTGIVFITKDNIDTWEEDLAKRTDEILASLTTTYLQKP